MQVGSQSMDLLTGALNESALRERFQQAKSSNELRVSCVAMVDIDDLHFFNEKFGHSTGDHVVRTLGRLLHREFEPPSSIYRCGGDEFLILVEGLDPLVAKERFGHLFDSLRNWRSEGFALSSVAPAAQWTCSVGLTDGFSTLAEGMSQAALLLHAAKKTGKAKLVAHIADT